MATEPFDRIDLQELANEIKFLSPRYQVLVTALFASYVRRLGDDLQTPEIRIDVTTSDDEPLPSLETIFETAFTPGRRSSGDGGPRGEDNGKVGGRFRINLDDFRQ